MTPGTGMWPFVERLSADDLRSVALMLGASEPELVGVLSRDRLVTIVYEYVTKAAGDSTLSPENIDVYVRDQIDLVWPGSDPLEVRLRTHSTRGVALVLRVGLLVASSDGVLSRKERKFLTESMELLGPGASATLLHSLPRKAVTVTAEAVDELEAPLRLLGADQETMRACLSYVAAVAVVDEVLRRAEIDTYYRIAELMGEDRKEAAILLEEVRRGYGQFLPGIDPVAAGRLSVPTAAALAAAERTGFAPFLSTHAGLKWLGGALYEPAARLELRPSVTLPNSWPTWASMLGALGAAISLSAYRGKVRFDRLLPLLLYRVFQPEPALPIPAIPEFTTPPW